MPRGFSRPAAWLRQLFTYSGAGGARDPNSLSNDVSLVQPYDGSGWGFHPPAETIFQYDSSVGATTDTVIFTVPATMVRRVLALSFDLLAGAAPAAVYLFASIPAVAGQNVQITQSLQTLISGRVESPDHHSPIILPGIEVHILVSTGNASTQVRCNMMAVEAPLGTVFYV